MEIMTTIVVRRDEGPTAWMIGDLGGIKPLLANIPITILKEELERRGYVRASEKTDENTTACGSPGRAGSYNSPLHVSALILILVLSTLACSFPIIARRFPRLPIPRHFLFLSRHFGTGVLIATAFVHLLPTAFVSLTNPCLPHFWHKGYPAMAGLVAMIGVMVVVLVEMFFAMRGAGHVHGSEYDTFIDGGWNGQHYVDPGMQAENLPFARNGERRDGIRLGKLQEDGPLYSASKDQDPSQLDLVEHGDHMVTRDHGRRHDMEDDESGLEELDPFPDECSQFSEPRNHHFHTGTRHLQNQFGSSQQNAQKQLLQCLLLEAGILFHSIFIGMALSVATGTSFVVLLVAISFHQTFEGLALGSRIASLIPTLFPAASPKPWLMALAYGATTPIGQVIGLGLHNLYDPGSATGLLMVGITNAFSSGLLLFAGLVEILAEDFLSDRSYEVLRGRSRLEACLAVASGAMLMAFVGAFA